jgi:hypothetical protein
VFQDSANNPKSASTVDSQDLTADKRPQIAKFEEVGGSSSAMN